MQLEHFSSRILAAALLAAMVTVPARAQQPQQDVEFQSFQIPGWSFTPSFAVGAIYDTNVALTTARADVGETQHDSFFSLVPGGQLEYLGKRSNFSANYRGFLRHYAEVDGLDGFDQRASLTFKRAMSRRLSFFARNSYSDSPTTDEVEVAGVPYRRVGSRSNMFGLGAEYRITKFTTMGARYDNTWVDFDRPDMTLAGGWIHALRGELTHQVSQRISVGGEYSYRTSSQNQGEREFGFQDVGGVVHFLFGPRTAGSVAAGFAVLRDRNADDTRSGPYLRTGIEHHLEKATVGASFERQYVPSFGFGGASSSQELRGYITMPLGRSRFYTQGAGGWRRTDPFESHVLRLDTVSIRSTVGYAASRWARIEALYNYTRQDSIVTGGEIDRHRVGVQFVVSQPMRIQ